MGQLNLDSITHCRFVIVAKLKSVACSALKTLNYVPYCRKLHNSINWIRAKPQSANWYNFNILIHIFIVTGFFHSRIWSRPTSPNLRGEQCLKRKRRLFCKDDVGGTWKRLEEIRGFVSARSRDRRQDLRMLINY